MVCEYEQINNVPVYNYTEKAGDNVSYLNVLKWIHIDNKT